MFTSHLCLRSTCSIRMAFVSLCFPDMKQELECGVTPKKCVMRPYAHSCYQKSYTRTWSIIIIDYHRVLIIGACCLLATWLIFLVHNIADNSSHRLHSKLFKANLAQTLLTFLLLTTSTTSQCCVDVAIHVRLVEPDAAGTYHCLCWQSIELCFN